LFYDDINDYDDDDGGGVSDDDDSDGELRFVNIVVSLSIID